MKTWTTSALLLAFGISVFPLARGFAAEPKDSMPAFGTLEGFVMFRGQPPKSSVTDNAGMQRDLLEVNAKSGGLRHVVVYLAHTNRPAPPAKAPTAKAAMDQQNYEFTPRVLAVREGQPVVFSNSDPANHNVRTSASVRQNEFNAFTGIDGNYEHRFVVEPGYRPIRLGCDIHPWMRGWIFVFDHPDFAVTDERGSFRISQILPGEYELHILQPDIGYREKRKIVINTGTTNKIEVVIQQEDARSTGRRSQNE